MQKKCKIAGAVVALGVAAMAYGTTLLLSFNREVAIAIALGIWIGFALCGLMRCKRETSSNSNEDNEVVSLFVGNLPFKTREAELREMFADIGTVYAIKIPRDRKSGRARGFGFVEMNKSDAKKAITKLDGKELNGRNLRINEANENTDEEDKS